MSQQEQIELKEKYYGEAIRYMDNAKESLGKAQKEGKFYNDPKYVRAACGTAYSGLLIALDCFLMLKGFEKPSKKQRKSIDYYLMNITKLDKKMLAYVNSAYQILHLYGYYDGTNNVAVIKEGFNNAYTLIEKIKP